MRGAIDPRHVIRDGGAVELTYDPDTDLFRDEHGTLIPGSLAEQKARVTLDWMRYCATLPPGLRAAVWITAMVLYLPTLASRAASSILARLMAHP